LVPDTPPLGNWRLQIDNRPSRISRRESAGSLKGKDGLARGFGGHRSLSPFAGERSTRTPSKPASVFNGDHVQKRQTPSGSELGYDVHIRHLTDSRPPGVGAVQEQMLDASGLQFALMFRSLAMIVDLSMPQPYSIFSRISTALESPMASSKTSAPAREVAACEEAPGPKSLRQTGP